MTDVSAEWIEKHGMVWDYYDEEAMTFFKTFEGREVIDLSKDEMARWVATSVTPLVDTYLKEKSGMGLPAADYEKYLKERVTYWNGKSPTSAQSVDWVKKNIEPLQKK
jgi:hypothetical protein